MLTEARVVKLRFLDYHSEESHKAVAAFFQYARGLEGAIPASLMALMNQQLGVDDGLLYRVRHDRQRGILRLFIRCGDFPIGYYDLVLSYYDAEISPECDQLLANVVRTTFSDRMYTAELYFYEFEVMENNLIAHRLVFHDGNYSWGEAQARNCSGEDHLVIEIQSPKIEWKMIPKPKGRSFHWEKDRYPGGPALELKVRRIQLDDD
ncbi:hypothetical protein CCB81_05535 [Armatimonadetes bacterium Uphvl-Ar2]|nr:hypothetical protein CCB81_05535 [Armatimonadetes bacterium Uphvl-Ar2]